MKNIRFSSRAAPLALLLLCFLAFGALIPLLGFYWDDWPAIWYLHFFGASSFKDGFAIDRPLLAWVFRLTTPLVGEAPWAWQTFAILTRWLSGLALWWTLRGLWPARGLQITAVTALFLIYPGFSQQYISVTYGNAFIVFIVFLLSLGSMVWALRRPRFFWPLILFSVAASAFCLFTAEYFFGLEFLRPLFLWLLLAPPGLPGAPLFGRRLPDDWRPRALRILRLWWPYIILLVLFVVWRLFLHETPRGQVMIFDQLRANPFTALSGLLASVLQDLFEVNILAWGQTLSGRYLLPLVDVSPGAVAGYFILALAALLLAFFFLKHWEEPAPAGDGQPGARPAGEERRRWALQSMLVGLYALLVGGWPFWVTNLHLELVFPWDRLTMPMMLGASLLLVGLLTYLLSHRTAWSLVLGLLVGLAVGWHYQLAWDYRQDWLAQRDFFWQLAWRAPGLEPGTLLLTSRLPFTYESDNSLSAPLNWMYAPELDTRQMPYMLYIIEVRLGSWLPSLDPHTPVYQTYRVTDYSGNTSQAIVFFYEPPRCLKVLDPLLDNNLPYKPRYYPEMPNYLSDALPLSRPDLILSQAPSPAQPPAAYFGPEPDHGWCYYFEKAELARQQGDWALAASLADQAMLIDRQLDRENASELTPFIDGYARTNRWDDAVRITARALDASPKMQNQLCTIWYYIDQETPDSPEKQTAVEIVNQNVPCTSSAP